MNQTRLPLSVPEEKTSRRECLPHALQVPILSSRGIGRGSRMLWEDGVKELAQLGFQMVAGCKSVSHAEALEDPKIRGKERLEHFGIWWHPAGVLAVGKSFLGEVSQLQLALEIDVGTGVEHVIDAWENFRGSSSTAVMSDGTTRFALSVDATNEYSLRSFLSVLQDHGKLVPVGKWQEQQPPYVPSELKKPVCSFGDWSAEKQRKLEETKEAEASLLSDFPPEAKEAFLKKWRLTEKTDASNALITRCDGRRKAHAQVSECLSLGGIRWPSEKDQEILKHWFEVADAKHGNAPGSWRGEGKGPAGVSLATVLVGSIHQNDTIQRFMEIVSSVSEETLQGWLTEPDASHYTLGLRILWNAVDSDAEEEEIIGLFDALAERVNPSSWKMETEGRNVLGILTQEGEASAMSLEAFESQFKKALSLIEHLQKKGVNLMLGSGFKWRSLENDPNEAPGLSRPFFSGDTDAWFEALRERMTPSLRKIGALAKAAAMDSSVTEANVKPKRQRM